jgi:hypothetical protein
MWRDLPWNAAQSVDLRCVARFLALCETAKTGGGTPATRAHMKRGMRPSRLPIVSTETKQEKDQPMRSAQELIDVIASVYKDKPDDYVVSVGHWQDEDVPDFRGGFVNIPRLYADIKLTAGELRALASNPKR